MSYASHIARFTLLTLAASPLVAQSTSDPAPVVPPVTQSPLDPVPNSQVIPMAESALEEEGSNGQGGDVPSVSELSRALSDAENGATNGAGSAATSDQATTGQATTDQATTDQTGEQTGADQTTTPQSTIPSQPVTAASVNSASYSGEGGLPEGRSPVTVKLQVLLDRADVSVSIIDGVKGGMTKSALMAYEERMGLPVDGLLDATVWDMLGGNNIDVYIKRYTISQADVQGLSAPLPSDYGELAQLDWMGFTSVSEKLAERFHMSEGFLDHLNPGAGYYAGETVLVTEPGDRAVGQATRIIIDKSDRRLRAWNAVGEEIANYPVAVGSAGTPSPSGSMTVEAVALEPTYHYNPSVNFQQGDNDQPLTLPPGPNGPVGLVWIDLSKPTYGIHGTPEPASLFTAHSHGCVRMANWDAQELASLVSEGITVEFEE
ncbi:L,D-transpeptidase family protein [Pseudosulfitobacter koreensis]|uniref:L,D-transpeptidase n=1 Tax=Pseudosulfitobacter koreensis TaxID=2968472 RepID=A0ABT1YXM4_9RHOB|nr:L,D-transpeptidase [Pseudosulfitobacter koreense]MCR8825633.1 L,D-transpeptidase [Pseudosulfitobacter koreense]